MTLNAPTQLEWTFVYTPLIVLLAAAFFIERRSQKIPNVLVGFLLTELLVTRALVGPQPLGTYLLSAMLVAVIALGIGWSRGYLGGGTAKLAVAVACAFTPPTAVVIALLLVSLVPVLGLSQRLPPGKSLSGARVILALCVAAMMCLTIFGHALQG